MRAFTRFGAVIIFALVALLSTILLLFSRTISTKLETLGLGPYVWDWGGSNDTDLALVVFGDSWVDDGIVMERKDHGFRLSNEPSRKSRSQGPTWTEVLCKELKCTSYHNFASSSPITIEHAPSGVLTSNSLYENTSMLPEVESPFTPSLPDLQAQTAAYRTLAPALAPIKTVFVVSFGIWDVYHYSMLSLSKEKSQGIASASLDILFAQLDDLFDSFTDQTENAFTDDELEHEKHRIHDFEVVIPKLIDPTFLLGWRSSRPAPLPPANVAEEQKIAVSMVEKWNSYMDEKIKDWYQYKPALSSARATATVTPSSDGEKVGDPGENADRNVGGDGQAQEQDEEDEGYDSPSPSLFWRKTIYRPDLQTYFVDALRTKYLEDHKIRDHNHLGDTQSPYESTSVPCAPVAGSRELRKSKKWKRGVSDALGTYDGNSAGGGDGEEKDESTSEELKEERDRCADAEKWFFWDEWDLGVRAQRDMGIGAGKLVKNERKKKAYS